VISKRRRSGNRCILASILDFRRKPSFWQFFDALSCKTKRGRERGKRRKGGEKREKREEKRREEIISLTPFLHMNMIIIETTLS
jgi:hypothetical protein